MNKISIKNATGNNIVGGSMVGSSLTIQAYSKPGAESDLQEEIEKLSVLVKQLIKNVSEQQAEQLFHDLDTLITEATSKQPRKKWYELSAEGILDAAKSSAELIEPISSVIKKLLEILAS